jgi:hypothetical protein
MSRIVSCALVRARAAPPALGKVVLLGTGRLPGKAADASGLEDVLGDGTPHGQVGSAGSGIAYAGSGNWYVMIADRGPKDGATHYRCRYHVFDIPVKPGEKPAVQPLLVATRFLTNGEGRGFVGLSSAFDAARPQRSLRLDPEGVRVGRTGSLFVADEYGPLVLEFAEGGRLRRVLKVPEKFGVARAGPGRDEEMPPHNAAGRQTNRGFEGLAISPDGSKLYALLQSCLLQDGRYDAEKKYVAGSNVRLLEIDVETNATREFVYPLDDPRNGVNEIVAVNAHEFLVIERDSLPGDQARFKKVVRIDIGGATDVSDIAALPETGLPEGVKPVTKRPFLDLLDPAYGLAGRAFPEKIEGLAFGPDLPDGRHLLLVTSDNDFKGDEDSQFYAFAIDPDDLPGFERQVIERPPSGVPGGDSVGAGGADETKGGKEDGWLQSWGGVVLLCLAAGALVVFWAYRMRRVG